MLSSDITDSAARDAVADEALARQQQQQQHQQQNGAAAAAAPARGASPDGAPARADEPHDADAAADAAVDAADIARPTVTIMHNAENDSDRGFLQLMDDVLYEGACASHRSATPLNDYTELNDIMARAFPFACTTVHVRHYSDLYKKRQAPAAQQQQPQQAGAAAAAPRGRGGRGARGGRGGRGAAPPAAPAPAGEPAAGEPQQQISFGQIHRRGDEQGGVPGRHRQEQQRREGERRGTQEQPSIGIG
jgi:hypothetical protein